jgi:carboxypeptidase Q
MMHDDFEYRRRVMKCIIVLLLTLSASAVAQESSVADRFKADAERLYEVTQADKGLWPLIAEFCDQYPARLSGSENLEKGIDWIVERMKRDGWDVRTQDVMVPNWKRGKESLTLITAPGREMPVLGLGGSVGTGERPVKAEVLVVKSFDDLKQRQAEAKGRIVVWNVPFTTYGETVRYRYSGASEAARYGAVASLVRSVGPFGMQTPHTGGMGYNDSLPKIPSAAITMEDAMLLERMQARGQRPVLALSMEARWEPDAPSRNIIIEIKGSELPNEVVVMGGHIDSWDVGTGAMDDASGCFVTWRALHHIHDLGLRPKRTLRVCFWTNEENGLRGGKGYEEQTRDETHYLGMEVDGGTFRPTGFSGSLPEDMKQFAQAVQNILLSRVGATNYEVGEGGADTSPLQEKGVPVMELTVDTTRYFWFHHTAADTPDKLDPTELNQCTYAVAVMAWAFANR